MKANWEAAFTFLPFKQCGGIFKITYEKNFVGKVSVHALKRNINLGKNTDEDNSNI